MYIVTQSENENLLCTNKDLWDSYTPICIHLPVLFILPLLLHPCCVVLMSLEWIKNILKNCIICAVQVAKDKYAVCGVHLPNSEDFAGHDETTISVALGYVAHLVQMISYFLHVPLRYPICHSGSRSKVIDHIIDKIPDKERE